MADPVSLKKLFYSHFLCATPFVVYVVVSYFGSKGIRQIPDRNKEAEAPQSIKKPRKKSRRKRKKKRKK